MHKIITYILLLIVIIPITHADNIDSSVIESGSLNEKSIFYKQIILKKARLERKKRIKLKIKDYLKSLDREKIINYSSNYKYKRKQQMSLSCELSAAADIMAKLTGRKVTEEYLLSKLDKTLTYNQLPKEVNGNIIWGDPNKGFVGYIDLTGNSIKASQKKMTGYGVLEEPISKLYRELGFRTKIITNKSHRASYDKKNHLSDLIENLDEGNAVQLWGDYCTDPNYEDGNKNNTCSNWGKNRNLYWSYYENGELVSHKGLSGEHAFYLLGYVGSKYNPSKIIVRDTSTGEHIYDIKEWYRKWDAMQNRSIIIYKKGSLTLK